MGNESQDNGYLTIGELAKRAGVTVRTLQYYDQIGLLSPSATDSQNHRFYSYEDLNRLYKILILKHLGMSLGDINDTQAEDFTPRQLSKLIYQQMEEVQQTINDLLKRMTTLRELSELMLTEQPIDWKSLATFIEDRQDESQFFWRLVSLQEASGTEPSEEQTDRKVRVNQWHGLIADAFNLIQNDIPPESEEGAVLAARYRELLSQQNEGEFPEFMLMGNTNPHSDDPSFRKMQQMVMDYLMAAMQAASQE